MAEETTVQTTQRDAEGQPQRGTNEATNQEAATQRGAGTQEPGANDEGRTVSYQSHMKLLNEKKTMQERLQAYIDAEEAQKPEADRTKRQLEAVTKERDELANKVRYADALTLAEKANARKASTVARLLAHSEDMAAELATLKKEDPALFQTSSIDAGANGKAQESTDMNSILRAAIRGHN